MLRVGEFPQESLSAHDDAMRFQCQSGATATTPCFWPQGLQPPCGGVGEYFAEPFKSDAIQGVDARLTSVLAPALPMALKSDGERSRASCVQQDFDEDETATGLDRGNGTVADSVPEAPSLRSTERLGKPGTTVGGTSDHVHSFWRNRNQR